MVCGVRERRENHCIRIDGRYYPVGARRRRQHRYLSNIDFRPKSRAVPDKYEPFDRDDFAPWRGARGMAMHGIGKDVRRRPRIKSTRPLVGQIGS